MKKKVLIVIVISMLVFLSNKKEIKANSMKNDMSNIAYEFDYPLLESIGEVVSGGSVEISGKQNHLYKVFSNRETALENLKTQETDALEYIAKKGHFDELTHSNYMQYYSELMQIEYEEIKKTMSTNSYNVLLQFFDIYENDDCNERIIKTMQNNSLNQSQKEEVLAYELPYYDNAVVDYFSNHHSIENRSFNVTNANTYAYANAGNTSSSTYGYVYSSDGNPADCANFASQILIAGGESMVNTFPNVYSGWWHVNLVVEHKYSRSWSFAPTFATYHSSSSFATRTYSTFTSKLQGGSFIAFDKGNDGSYDHIAYVTSVNNFMSGGYYDHNIAQHSPNYYNSASYSMWPSLEDGVCWFLVIRGGK